MFELLLLSAVVLIVLSQTLPEDKPNQSRKNNCSEDLYHQEQKRLACSRKTKSRNQKQPCQKISSRAALNNFFLQTIFRP
jgi:hypothetical protein